MKLMSSGRTLVAAMMMSPSFSRSASSISTTILPSLRSAMMSSILSSSRGRGSRVATLLICLLIPCGQQPLQITRDQIDFQIDRAADLELPERGVREGVRDDHEVEAQSRDFVDGQAYSIHTHRALARDVARQRTQRLEA